MSQMGGGLFLNMIELPTKKTFEPMKYPRRQVGTIKGCYFPNLQKNFQQFNQVHM